jgi:hypothetical protein
MSKKRTDQAGTKKRAETPVSKREQAAMEMPTIEHVREAELEPERRPDDEEVDTAAEQRPPADS